MYVNVKITKVKDTSSDKLSLNRDHCIKLIFVVYVRE